LTWFMKMWAALRSRRNSAVNSRMTAAPAPPALPQPSPPRHNPPGPARRSRSLSPSLTKTIDLLRQRPDLTAQDVAAELKLSPSYARTLLRRAQSHVPVAVPGPAPVVAQPPVQTTIARLHQRITQTEQALAALHAAPSDMRATCAGPNRRAEILRLAESGYAAPDIAAKLAIPGGEVEFILKVNRVLRADDRL
jgi:DNA-binding CsgD family transcriptional regulator